MSESLRNSQQKLGIQKIISVSEGWISYMIPASRAVHDIIMQV